MKLFKLTISALAVLMYVLISTDTFSQHSTSLGLESGINISNMSVTPAFNTSTRTGFMVGGFADVGVSNVVSIRPGLRYILKGFSTTGNGITVTDKLSYLEIPVLIKAAFPLPDVKPYIIAGPQLGINLSATSEASDGVNTQDFDASTVYETIDFGLYFGSGVEFHVAHKTDMFIGGGYSLGLTNVVKLNGITGKNGGFQFTGGVKFGL